MDYRSKPQKILGENLREREKFKVYGGKVYSSDIIAD